MWKKEREARERETGPLIIRDVLPLEDSTKEEKDKVLFF